MLNGNLCIASFVSSVLTPRRKVLPARHVAANEAPAVIDNSTLEHLHEALSYINPDLYDEWTNTGHALKTLGEIGRELWFVWSKTSTKFISREAEKKWKSFNPTNTSHKTIFAAAMRNGWQNKGYSQDVPPVDCSGLMKQFAKIEVKQDTSRYRPLSDADLEAMPSIAWRLKGVLPAQGIVAIYGASKAGKSFLAFDQACAIAEGREWFGYRVSPAAVLYVGLEGEAGYKMRARAWKCHHGRPLPAGLRVVLQPFRLTDTNDVNDLAAIVPKGCVIFIDTMNRAAPTADENSSRDMGEIIEGAKNLQYMTGGLVVLIAHTGKDTTKGLRGHSSLIAALDAAINVTREGDTRSWNVDKCKDGKDGSKHTFQLNVINVGIDEDGDVLTSCVVTPNYSEALPGRDRPLSANQKLGMKSFDEAAGTVGSLDEHNNFIGVHLENWRIVFYRMSTADSKGAKEKAFQRVRRELVELDKLLVSNDIYRMGGIHAHITESCIAKVLTINADIGHTL